MRVDYFTICSSNYLAYALTLYNSLRQAAPEAAENFTVFLADELNEARRKGLPFPVVEAREIGIPTFWDMAFRYSVIEFNTAIKPSCFKYLFRRGDVDAAMYLDPDLFVNAPLTEAIQALEDGKDVVLTPHTLTPLEDGFDPDDLRILRTGTYNLGFLALRNSTPAGALLDWWERKLSDQCIIDLDAGIFVDQKFMDLAPSFCEHTFVLHHPGYNAAYWNLAGRTVTREGEAWLVNGRPLVFFHFSGVRPGSPKVFSAHQNRFGPDDLGDLKPLFLYYLEQIAANDHDTWRSLPYAYGRLTDGTVVPDIVRKCYGRYCQPSTRGREDLFAPASDWLFEPAPEAARAGAPGLSRLLYTVWNERSDVRAQFPLAMPQGREGFLRWFFSSAPSEYNLPDDLVNVLRNKYNAELGNGASAGASLRQRLARAVLSQAGTLRALYRRLPEPMRMKARQALVRSASRTRDGASSSIGLYKDRNHDIHLTPGMDVYGYFRTVSGVGEGGRRMLDVLRSMAMPVAVENLASFDRSADILPTPPEPSPKTSAHSVALFHVNADQIEHVFAEIELEQLKGRYRIGYWAWELPVFPEPWLRMANYLNEIWVPSTFIADALCNKVDIPVHVVPHPALRLETPAARRSEFALPEDVPLILCSADVNSFSARKNPQGAYEAFCKAFDGKPGDKSPRLVVKLHGINNEAGERQKLVELLAADPRVILIDMPLSAERYAGLQSCCDAYISLHRAEGFGLNIAEMMALGKPVIATHFGGCVDFMKPSNAFCIPYARVPVPENAYPFAAGQEWAEPDLDEAAKALRSVVSAPAAARKRGAAAANAVNAQLSMQAVAETVRQNLMRVDARILGGAPAAGASGPGRANPPRTVAVAN